MERLKLRAAGVLVAVALFAVFRGCRPQYKVPVHLLQANDKQAVFIDTRHKAVVIEEPGKQPTIKEGVRHAEIHIKKDGSVELSVRDHGFCFEPGVSGFYSSNSFLYGGDATAYYRGPLDFRLGFGIVPGHLDSFRGYAAVAYAVPHLTNTSVFIGETTDLLKDLGLIGLIENIAIGIRVGL